MNEQKIHILTAPLKIATPDAARPYYLLPAGTTLYYDGSMPEGFDRYYVYFNVEGSPLTLSPVSPPGMIAPMSAYPLDKEELISLLAKYPLSRVDLQRILHANAITRQELIDIVNAYQE